MDTKPSNRRRNTAGFFGVLAFSIAGSVVAQTPKGSPGAHPDFGGAWSSATAIPLERPALIKDKPFYTREEADELQKKARGANDDPLSRMKKGAFIVNTARGGIIDEPA